MKIIEHMTLNEMNLTETSYINYARAYDAENGTKHAERISELHHNRMQKQHAERNEQREQQQQHAETITYNNGQQRNVVGNYNDNEIMIEKTFNHLNSLKRALSLSQQSDDETMKMFHENIFYRELLNLELSLRTMKTNIKKQKNN